MRSRCLVLLLLLLSSLLSVIPGDVPPVLAVQENAKPNIILIVTDDQDFASLAQMPNVQALAAEGLTFTNFLVTTPICCPSRASIMRGQYAHNHQVRYNEAPGGAFIEFYDRDLGDDSVFSWLAAAGYQTGVYGKFLNDYPAGVSRRWKPAGVSDWAALTRGHYQDFTLNQNGRQVDYKGPENYQTTVLGNLANEEMVRSERDNAPFFLYISPLAVHTPLISEPKQVGRFAGVTAPRTPAFGEADTSDKPGWVRQWNAMTPERAAAIDDNYRQRLEALASVDDLVGRLRETLRVTGQADNTYIVFTSDNGWLAGAHNMEGKQSAYTESLRVPTVIWGPGVRAGETEDRVALNIDLAPTIAEWAGAKPAGFVDGRSLVPLLGTGEPAVWRETALIEYWRHSEDYPKPRRERRAPLVPATPRPGQPAADGSVAATPSATIGGDHAATPAPRQRPPRIRKQRLSRFEQRAMDNEWDGDLDAIAGAGALPPGYVALRSREFLYVEYTTGEREYYDLVTDPFELENRYDQLTAADRERLSARVAELKSCAGAACRAAEDQAE